jgi:hypothetical protein
VYSSLINNKQLLAYVDDKRHNTNNCQQDSTHYLR